MLSIELFAGYIGAMLSLIAFVLSSLERLSRGSYRYMALNGIGAFLLVYYAIISNALLFGFLNVIWGSVEIFYLIKKVTKKSYKRNRK